MKFSAVLLVPVCLILFILKIILVPKVKREKFKIKTILITLLLILVIFITSALIIYNFQSVKPFNDPETIRLWEENEYLTINSLKTPLLKIFQVTTGLRALSWFNNTANGGHYSYILGEFDQHGGWWYYFPLAFLIKTPLITLALILLSLIIAIKYALINRKNLLWRKLHL